MPAPPTNGLDEVQIAMISSRPGTIDSLLQADTTIGNSGDEFSTEQFKDKQLKPVTLYLRDGILPEVEKSAKSCSSNIVHYSKWNSVLYVYRSNSNKYIMSGGSTAFTTQDHAKIP